MKRTLSILILLFPTILFTQSVSEKFIFDVNSISKIKLDTNNYSNWLYFNYDRESGTYVYIKYDSINASKVKRLLISNKGNSRKYDGLDNLIFDKEGNYYSVTFDSISKNNIIYYLIKNGNEFIKSNRVIIIGENNGFIYFIQDEKDKRTLYNYDYINEKLFKSKPYYMTSEIHFTKKGNPYFFAQSDSHYPGEEHFIVIDDKEQKHYSDIFLYGRITSDSVGYPLYLAKDEGKFSAQDENLGMFLVWGKKEYKKFEIISTSIIINDSGCPVYIGRNFKDPENKFHLIKGDKEIGNAYYNISELQLTPKKKIIFIADIKKNIDIQLPQFMNDNSKCVVYDGIEGNVYCSIKNLKVYPNDKFIYLAEKKDKEKVIVTNDGEIKISNSNSPYIDILDEELLPDGRFIYASYTLEYRNLKPEYKANIKIGDEELGPYISLVDLNGYSKFFKFDSSGNYCYIINTIGDYSNEIKHILYTNLGRSSEHDLIFDINFHKGKILYIGYENTERKYYFYKRKIYYDFQPISLEYDDIRNYKFDESKGIITFLGLINYKFYDVEISLD